MATTVVKTIGTGGDYTTAQAWEDASPADLVAANQVWEGQLIESVSWGSAAVSWLVFGGSTTSVDCYKHLTVQPGLSFVDNADALTNPLRFDKSSGIWLEATNIKYSSILISFQENFATLSKLQIDITSQADNVGLLAQSTTNINIPKGRAFNCIIESRSSNLIAREMQLSNCLLYAYGSTIGQLMYWGDGASKVEYCTFVVSPTTVIGTSVIRANYSAARDVRDCALFGRGVDAVRGPGITTTNCYSDSPQTYAGITQTTYDTSNGSGFENISAGTEDFRIKATSVFVDAGEAIPVLPYDIVGTLRGDPPDVGCWEYTDQGGAVDHHTSGSIVGSGADTAGSADHRPTSVTHSSGGNIVGKTSDVTGASSSFSKLTSSGALLGDFGTVTGTSTRFRAHPAVGALLGDFGTVTGAADQSSPVGEHDVEGDIVAGTGTVTGQSHSVGYRPTTGAIVGNTGVVAGTAKHIKMHATHGDPIGAGSIVVGAAHRSDPIVDHGTFGEIDGYQANLFGNATHSQLTLTQADIDAIVAGIVAAIIPVNIVKVNSIDVDGTGADNDPWGPV